MQARGKRLCYFYTKPLKYLWEVVHEHLGKDCVLHNLESLIELLLIYKDK